MKNLYQGIFTSIVFATLSSFSFAESINDPLVGKWKTVDDRTGYSRADVEISKKPDGTYEGIIVATRSVPGTEKMLLCTNCPGNLKGKPFLGLPFIWGFKQNPDNPREFNHGRVLDPIGGKIYQGKARISASGKHLNLRGYVGVSVIGRSVTWIKY
jgi:uncharacterized protein (DUF2147 family)